MPQFLKCSYNHRSSIGMSVRWEKDCSAVVAGNFFQSKRAYLELETLGLGYTKIFGKWDKDLVRA